MPKPSAAADSRQHCHSPEPICKQAPPICIEPREAAPSTPAKNALLVNASSLSATMFKILHGVPDNVHNEIEILRQCMLLTYHSHFVIFRRL